MAKILLITTEFPPVLGGIGTYCYQLARATAARGHDITVFAPDFGKSLTELAEFEGDYEVVRYPGGAYTIRDFGRYFRQVWGQLGAEKYDIVHAADWPTGVMMRNVNRFRRVPYRLMVHGTDVLLARKSRQIRYLANGLFTRPERITTNSEFTRNLLLENFPEIDASRVHAALLGVGEEWFEPATGVAETLAAHGIPEERFRILTVARLDERKGHRLVFRALAELPADVAAQMVYVVVGKGDADYTAELKALAERCPVQTIFTGPVPGADLKPLYASADVFCMPGEPHGRRVEGFGLSYLEAAAQGVPAIASAIGAIPEVIADGRTGFVVPPMDVEALRAVLLRTFEDSSLRHRLGDSARQWARTFTWDRCAQQTYEAE